MSSVFLQWVEGPSDLLVSVAVLPEGGPHKLQFTMQALLVTRGSGPVHQHGEYSLFVGRMVVRVSSCEWVCGKPDGPVNHQVYDRCQYQEREGGRSLLSVSIGN
jgi:hypothetical protein